MDFPIDVKLVRTTLMCTGGATVIIDLGGFVATVTEVARRANVSPGIVSRLLNEDPTLRVREDTRQRILQAAKDLDYSPNAAARALRMSRSGTIGLAVHDASNPVYTEIIAGAQDEATRAGYALMLADVDALAQGGAIFRRVISSGSIDGLLLQRGDTDADAFVSRLTEKRVPMVVLNDRTEGHLGSVGVDDYAASMLAMSHLLGLGHRAIGYLGVDGALPRSELRRRGWEDSLRAAGVPIDRSMVVNGGHTAQSGYEGMTTMLARPQRPTAVFAANVLAGVGALSACRDQGVRVPEEMSVVGLHDFPLAEHLSPRLTVVRLPLFQMGARAVQLLLKQFDDGVTHHETITEPAPLMVVRESSSIPRI
ncbi:LacI family transcriptional regulator [Microbacterium marinum]|uniref:LacI family DNA-binding transcriptional regulator n=1 Tax=Microbacterium marinum TaxID=421115 RepID=UPI00384A5B68